jgi:hypothetical protein
MLNRCAVVDQVTEAYGVTQIEEGLYTSTALTPTGCTIYLGFEKVKTKAERQFWHTYYRLADFHGRELLRDQSELLRMAEYSHRVFNETDDAVISKFLEDNKKRFTVDVSGQDCAYQATKDGLYGFGKVLEKIDMECDVYIAYASKMPIKDKASRANLIGSIQESLKFYIDNYQYIIMTMGCVMKKNNLLSTTHMGICRNPLEFLDTKYIYSRIAMIVQGIAAECGNKLFAREIQVNLPTPGMKKMLKDNCGEDNVYNSISQLRTAMDNIVIPETTSLFDLDNCRVGMGSSIVIKLNILSSFYHKAYAAYEHATYENQNKLILFLKGVREDGCEAKTEVKDIANNVDIIANLHSKMGI